MIGLSCLFCLSLSFHCSGKVMRNLCMRAVLDWVPRVDHLMEISRLLREGIYYPYILVHVIFSASPLSLSRLFDFGVWSGNQLTTCAPEDCIKVSNHLDEVEFPGFAGSSVMLESWIVWSCILDSWRNWCSLELSKAYPSCLHLLFLGRLTQPEGPAFTALVARFPLEVPQYIYWVPWNMKSTILCRCCREVAQMWRWLSLYHHCCFIMDRV